MCAADYLGALVATLNGPPCSPAGAAAQLRDLADRITAPLGIAPLGYVTDHERGGLRPRGPVIHDDPDACPARPWWRRNRKDR